MFLKGFTKDSYSLWSGLPEIAALYGFFPRKTFRNRGSVKQEKSQQRAEFFYKKTLTFTRTAAIIATVVSEWSFLPLRQNRICGYGGTGRRVRFRF